MALPRGGCSNTFHGRVNRIHYLWFYNYSGTGVIFSPPFGKTWNVPLTTLTITAAAKYNHKNPSGNHAYV
jgi:hypothetical protein